MNANETHTNSDQMEFDFGERDIAENGTAQNADTGNFLISAILNADPELAEDVKNRTETDEEKRIEKLRENGMRGGRPRIERSDLARMCADAVFTKHGQYLLRRHKKNWYHYRDGAYAPMRDDDVRMKVSGWINRSKVADVSRTLIGDILESIGDDSMCGLTADKYTKPCFISTGESAFGFVSMKNGIINIDEIANALKNGLTPPAVRPHTPDLFTTVRLPYEYDPTATCPNFKAYLEGVQPEAENREMLQLLAGWFLTQDMSYNVAFFLFGEGGTGKSIFMDVLENLVGEEDCCCVPLASFAEKFGTADLTEKKSKSC